jgi:DNA-binding phage protein
MIELYRKDPEFAAYLLNAVLNDGDTEEIRYYLKMMNAAFGDGSGQPKDIDGLIATINAMGCRLSVAPKPSKTPKPRRRAAAAKPGTPKRAVRTRRSAAKTPAKQIAGA